MHAKCTLWKPFSISKYYRYLQILHKFDIRQWANNVSEVVVIYLQ